MKAKKHTKALIMALSVVSMLMASLFVVNTGQAGANVVECPEYFEVSEDGKSCWQEPSRVTVTPPPECKVRDEWGHWVPKGDITPDGKHCITAVGYNSQDPAAKGDVIDAKVNAGTTSYTCPSGWTLDGATNTCSTSIAQGNETVAADSSTGTPTCSQGTLSADQTTCNIPAKSEPGTYVPAKAATPDSCPAGYTYFAADSVFPAKCYANPINNFTACPAGGAAYSGTQHEDGTIKDCIATIIPGTDAVSATCNGVATTGTAAQCVTNTPATTVDPTPGATAYYCSDGWMLINGNQCTRAAADKVVTKPADPVTSGGSVTCPTGYSGPTSDGKCERTVLTARPDVPTCEEGTLLKVAKNQYTCLLDNKPVTDEPEVRATCTKGKYDPKQDKCFVGAEAGSHEGSVNVVDKKGAEVSDDAKKPADKPAPAKKPVAVGFTG